MSDDAPAGEYPMGVARPRVRLDAVNRPFWTGGGEGRLLICRCRDCAAFIHPPQPMCRACWSDDVGPEAVSGRARVQSYTVNHQPWAPGMKVPFVIARVALEDAPGVILTTNIVGCAPETVSIGQQVQVVFEEQDGIFYPLFEPTDTRSGS